LLEAAPVLNRPHIVLHAFETVSTPECHVLRGKVLRIVNASAIGNDMESEIFDVLIIGAGLSGIDAAYRLQTECPSKTFAILEARESIGGTWDLFRYPGIRSDSDVETLGFPFKPWVKEKSIADGPAIRDYIKSTAAEFGIDQKIRFGMRVEEARWNSQESLWELSCVNLRGERQTVRSRFVYSCTGYYSYAEAYQPQFSQIEKFKGTLIHPQFWPQSFDPTDKTIVVIGSGATAITLVPSLSEKAKSVTMLQRSPTYVVSRPAIDPVTQKMKALLPRSLAHRLVRLKNILYGISVYQYAKKKPDTTRLIITKMAKKELPASIDVSKHFNPRYQPWDQRLCLAPDGDFFAALRSGKANVATDEIEKFEENGIRLRTGQFLEADAVVTATGLKLQLVGGMKLYRDNAEIDLSQKFSYKGVLLSDVPNFAIALGYTNASWTLKCDLSAQYVCRLLNYMDSRGYKVVSPYVSDSNMRSESLIDLSSNYIKRSEKILPKQGSRKPWKLHQNFFWDWFELNVSRVNDGNLKFN
jgi:monooxygenase